MASGSTTNYNFPYPEPQDPVNVATDIQGLADSIDTNLQEIIEDKSAKIWVFGTFSNGLGTPSYNDIAGTMSWSLTQDLTTAGTPSFSGLSVSASSGTDAIKITQTGAGNVFLVEDSASTDSSPFVINNAGNVGIGLTSPTALLEIQDNTNTANLVIGGSGSADVMKIGTPSGDSLALYTNGSEALRIDTSGYVGIGTTSPSTILDVDGTLTSTLVNITSTTLTLNSTTSGSPTDDAYIKVERGTSPDVSLRWNETEMAWQFTNDGTNYESIGGGGMIPVFFLGGM